MLLKDLKFGDLVQFENVFITKKCNCPACKKRDGHLQTISHISKLELIFICFFETKEKLKYIKFFNAQKNIFVNRWCFEDDDEGFKIDGLPFKKII